jgi:polyisoprenyl-teichoic acid--peptidoglycan teichoic acid transferase
MIKSILLLIVLLFTTTGCSLSSLAIPSSAVKGSSPSTQYRLITADPHAAPTATPFQPLAATVRPANAATATAQVFQATQATTSIVKTSQASPTARPVQGRYPDGQVRILVLGSDARPGGGFRTDIIILVSINPKSGTVTALSFPRDLWVDLPGWGTNRINTAMVYGGFSLMASTLESNFGIRPTHYVMANFNSFIQIIDSLGGVDVKAALTLRDTCKLPEAVGGYCTVNPGVKHMNGTFALWYVRSRYSSSDFDRERRSQEVLLATFNKLMSLNAITRIPELFNIYQKNVETNLTLADIAGLATIAPGLVSDPSKIQRYSIGPTMVSNWTVPESGAMVLLPNEALIQQTINQAVFTP